MRPAGWRTWSSRLWTSTAARSRKRPPEVHTDASLLKQVFANLPSNAFRFTRGCERAVVEVNCTRDDSEHVFMVRDNGAGFDMKYAAKLFAVFQRLHSQEQFAGTGVGLSLVQRIVTRHGGGATFHFSLPA